MVCRHLGRRKGWSGRRKGWSGSPNSESLSSLCLCVAAGDLNWQLNAFIHLTQKYVLREEEEGEGRPFAWSGMFALQNSGFTVPQLRPDNVSSGWESQPCLCLMRLKGLCVGSSLSRTCVCVFGCAWTLPGTAGLWPGEPWVQSQHEPPAVLVQRASNMNFVCLFPGSCARRFPCPLRKHGCCSFRAVLSIS